MFEEDTNRNHNHKEHKTEAGKELGIYRVANTALYKIAFTSGGELPKALEGMYTSPSKAMTAIEGYLATHKPRKTTASKKTAEG